MPTDTCGRILVGIDEDPASMQAVALGAEIARALSCQLDLLSVIDTSQLDVFDDFYRSESSLRRTLERERSALLQSTLHRLKHPLPRYCARLRHGDVCHILLEEAAQSGSTLLVLGKSGKSVSERVLLGSVSRAMLRKCPIPLLLVGPTQEQV